MNRLLLILGALLTLFVIAAPVAAQSATPEETATPAPATNYLVQPGDTLTRLSLRFGVAVDALVRANNIVNPNLILVGQLLTVPGANIAPNPPEAFSTYTVQAGDTLYRIALRASSSVSALAQLNGIANPNLIYNGQVLRLPLHTVMAETPTVSSAPPATVPATATVLATTAPPVATEASTATEAPTATVLAATQETMPQTPVVATPEFGTGGAAIATANPTAVPVPRDPKAFAFGVTINLDGDSAIKAASDLGVRWVRHAVSWKSVEREKGVRDYTELDLAVQAYDAAGFSVLLTLAQAPDWARKSLNEEGPPVDFADFASFVKDVAQRYKGKVQAYEIWSEPNLRRNWNGRPLSAASYVELLRLASGMIRGVDKDALVISAGLAPTGFDDAVNAIDDRVFLRQAYAAGLSAFVDAVGTHPLGWANPPDATCCTPVQGVKGWYNDPHFYFRETLGAYHKIMQDAGDNSHRLWVTAFGWGSNDGILDDARVDEARFGFVKYTSRALQAQYMARSYEIGRDLGYVGPMFAISLNGCQAVNGDVTSIDFYLCYYSLLDTNGLPRPSFEAIKALVGK